MHAVKVSKTKDKCIIISSFKMDILPIMGGIREGGILQHHSPLLELHSYGMRMTGSGDYTLGRQSFYNINA